MRKRSGPNTSTSWPSACSSRDDGLDRAHHAVDLRAPGVGDDGDAQSGYSAASRAGAWYGSTELLARDLLGPVHDAQAAVEILDQRGAALHPVAVVAVEDAVDVADLGVMDVAADHAVDAAPARLAGDGVLEVGDELHRVLDLVLEVGRERPVVQPELAARPVERGVEAQRRGVGPVAQDREPAWRSARCRRTGRRGSPAASCRRASRGSPSSSTRTSPKVSWQYCRAASSWLPGM